MRSCIKMATERTDITYEDTSELILEIIFRLNAVIDRLGLGEDSELAEELEEVQKHLIVLDSLMRIPEELFNLLTNARSLLNDNTRRAEKSYAVKLLVDQHMT